MSEESDRIKEGRVRLNRYRPSILAKARDYLCDKYGHRRVIGPRRGDGATVCTFCNTFIGYDRFGNFKAMARKFKELEPNDPKVEEEPL